MRSPRPTSCRLTRTPVSVTTEKRRRSPQCDRRTPGWQLQPSVPSSVQTTVAVRRPGSVACGGTPARQSFLSPVIRTVDDDLHAQARQDRLYRGPVRSCSQRHILRRRASTICRSTLSSARYRTQAPSGYTTSRRRTSAAYLIAASTPSRSALDRSQVSVRPTRRREFLQDQFDRDAGPSTTGLPSITSGFDTFVQHSR